MQYRLRTLLIVTTIVAVWLGWWSHKARQQREAVAALRNAGFSAGYSFRLPWTGGIQDPPKWPFWLVKLIGVDYLANVTFLELRGRSELTEADIAHIRNLTALGWVIVPNTGNAYLRLKQSFPDCHITRL